MELSESLFALIRNLADPLLLIQKYPIHAAILAVIGLLLGIHVAYICFYKRASLIKELEEEQKELRKGDIKLDDRTAAITPPAAASTRTEKITEKAVPETSKVATSAPAVERSAANDLGLKTYYAEAPDDPDDLTLLEGIDHERATELNRAGIYRYSQLADLDEEGRRKFGFKFGWPDINWGAWGATAAAAGVGGAALLSRGRDNFDWPDWKWDDIDETEAHVDLAKDETSTVTLPPQIPNPETISETVETNVVEQSYDVEEETEEEEQSPIGTTIATAGAAIAGATLLNVGKDDDEEVVEEQVVTQEETYEEEIVEEQPVLEEETRQAPPSLIATHEEQTEDADDLTLLEGIDDEKAAELNRAGVYKFSQLEELDEEQRRSFGDRFNWPDIDWGKWGTIGAVGAASAAGVASLLVDDEDEEEASNSQEIEENVVITDHTEEETVEEIEEVEQQTVTFAAADEEEIEELGPDEDLELTTYYSVVPHDADDLTQLEGIDEHRAYELNQAGIYKFSQLDELDEEQRSRFGRKFRWPDLDWGKWAIAGTVGTAAIAGANALRRDDEEEEYEVTTTEQEVITEEYTSTEEPVAEEEEEVDLQLANYYSVVPHDADDLTQLEDVDEERAAELNRAGIYKFSQLDEMDEDQRERFGRKFRWPDFSWGKWGTLGALTAAAAASSAALLGDDDDEAEEIEEETVVVEHEESVEDTDTQHFEFQKGSDLADREDTESDTTWGWRFRERPEDADDLTQMEGISEDDAAELNRQGVYTFKQLEELPEEKREEVRSRFGWGDIDWGKWGTLGALGTAAVAGGAALLNRDEDEEEENANYVEQEEVTVATTEEQTEEAATTVTLPEVVTQDETETTVRPDWTWGYTYTGNPGVQADDFTSLEGISDEDAERLRAEGIYTFQQLEELPEERREEVKSRFGWGDIDWGKWGTLSAIGTAAAVGGSALLGEDDDDHDDEQEEVETIDDTSVEVVESELASRGDTETDSTWGWRFRERPEDADDLTQMEGISEDDAAELNRQGVYTFRQLEELPEEKREEVRSRFGWGDIDWGKWGTLGALGTAAVAGGSALLGGDDEHEEESQVTPVADEENVETRVNWGDVDWGKWEGEESPSRTEADEQTDQTWTYTHEAQAPDDADDLTQAEGVSAEDAAELNRQGIYSFKQLEELPEEQREEVKTKFGWGDIDWAKWGTAGAVASTAAVAGAAIAGQDDEEDTAEEVATVETTDQSGSPAIEGDHTQPIDVNAETKRGWDYTINEQAAVETTDTIATDEVAPAAAEADLTAHEPEPIKPSTMDYLVPLNQFDGEDADLHESYGIVYTHDQVDRDDLTAINGIDDEIESGLNQRGIYRYKQVANWNTYNRWAFERDLNLPGQIKSQEWIEQAQSLITTDSTESATDTDDDSSTNSIATGAIAAAGAVVGVAAVAPTDDNQVVAEEPPVIEEPAPPAPAPEPRKEQQPTRGIFGTAEKLNQEGSDQRVAFIMDVSRSLTPAQLRLSKDELISAINSLAEGSLYQVIFFSGPTWFAHQRMTQGGARGEDVVIEDATDGTTHHWKSGFGGFEYQEGNEQLPTGSWREVTEENIAATIEDIEAVGKSYGTTWHLPLTMAMDIEPAPKTIYFLTDGETARQEQVAVEMIAKSKEKAEDICINTIALMVPGASVPLSRIARGTGGEYSLVIAGGKVLKDNALKDYLAEKEISIDE